MFSPVNYPSVRPFSSKPGNLKNQKPFTSTNVNFSGNNNAEEKEDLLKELVAYENKNPGVWKQVGQRLKRFFQDLGNSFKRLFSHKADFALDNSLEEYKKKLIELFKKPDVEQWLQGLTSETKNQMKYYVESDKSPSDKKERYKIVINSIESLEKSKKMGPMVASGLLDEVEPSVDHLLLLGSQIEPAAIPKKAPN